MLPQGAFRLGHRQDVDLGGAGIEEKPGAYPNGASGGDDVVDQQDCAAIDKRGGPRVGSVLLPQLLLRSVEGAIACRSAQNLGMDGESGHTGESSRDVAGDINVSLRLSRGARRDGYDEVYFGMPGPAGRFALPVLEQGQSEPSEHGEVAVLSLPYES